MIRFPASPSWSQFRLPEVRRGGPPLARRDVLKICGFAAGAAVAATLAGCADGGQGQVKAQPTSTGFFTDGTDFVD